MNWACSTAIIFHSLFLFIVLVLWWILTASFICLVMGLHAVWCCASLMIGGTMIPQYRILGFILQGPQMLLTPRKHVSAHFPVVFWFADITRNTISYISAWETSPISPLPDRPWVGLLQVWSKSLPAHLYYFHAPFSVSLPFLFPPLS